MSEERKIEWRFAVLLAAWLLYVLGDLAGYWAVRRRLKGIERRLQAIEGAAQQDAEFRREIYRIVFTQDATGGRYVAWATNRTDGTNAVPATNRAPAP